MKLTWSRLPLALALALGTACVDSGKSGPDAGSTADGDPADGNDGNGDGTADGDADGDAGGDGSPDPDAGEDAGLVDPALSLLPWKEGNSWTYNVIKGGVLTVKVTTIGPEEAVGGTGPNKDKLAHRVTTKKGDSDETVSWQGILGDKVVRYREQSFGATSGLVKVDEHWDPYKLHIDNSEEHTQAGATWVEQYDETKITMGDADAGVPDMTATAAKSDSWVIDAVNEQVTVPAGTFNAIVLQKSNGTDIKTYWYVPGVGKVKETGSQVEELVSYEIVE